MGRLDVKLRPTSSRARVQRVVAEVRAKRRRVCAVTAGALERIGPTGPHAVIANGVEPAEWRALGEPPESFAQLSRPRFLYVGSLGNRVDVEQVAEVARAYPDGSVVFVGPSQDEAHFAAVRGPSKPPAVAPALALGPAPEAERPRSWRGTRGVAGRGTARHGATE